MYAVVNFDVVDSTGEEQIAIDDIRKVGTVNKGAHSQCCFYAYDDRALIQPIAQLQDLEKDVASRVTSRSTRYRH